MKNRCLFGFFGCVWAFLLFFLAATGDVGAQNNGLQAQIPTSEYSALVDLYNSTGGARWINKGGWLYPNASSSIPNVPSWEGVYISGVQYDSKGNVTGTGHVTEINLSGNRLSGVIPSSIGNLPHLTALELSDNQLSGTIPSSIGNLTNLTQLELDDNQLSGTILSSIGNLTHLTDLRLESNQLSGTIPSAIGNLTNLTILDLEANQLSGEIPSTIGNLTNLTFLELGGNQLSGTIPSSIGNLTHLTYLDLGANQLSGEIPSSIGNLTNLTYLYLEANQLSGEIPASIANFKFGTYLYIDFNDFNVSSQSQNLAEIKAASSKGIHVAYEPQNPVPSMVMRRVCASIPSSVTNGTAEADANTALEPTTDPNILQSLPPVTAGLVADGVTPLILEFDAPGSATTATAYTLSVDDPAVASNLYVLADGKWGRGNTITVSPGQPAFAYVQGLLPEQVQPDFTGTETVNVSVAPGSGGASLSVGTFALATPPVVLVHGYAADGSSWSGPFMDQLEADKPCGFVTPITYDSKSSGTNKGGSLFLEVENLDEVLSGTIEPGLNGSTQFPGWAFTRYDVVAHSQGGVLTRMLCTVNSSAPKAQSTPFGTPAYRSPANFYRGRFRRVVTIGSPHNGTRFLHYLLRFEHSGSPLLRAAFLGGTLSGFVQGKFDPFGEEIQAINSPSFFVDPKAPFNLVSGEISGGAVPAVPTTNLDYLATFLCGRASFNPYTVGQIVLGGNNGSSKFAIPDVAHGNGSDGIVDRVSQEGGPGCHVTEYTDHDVSHSDFPGLFGIFKAGQSEASDPGLAYTIAGLLESPESEGRFGPFVLPTLYLPNGPEQQEIDDVVPNITTGDLIILAILVFDKKKSVVAASATSSSYSFSLTPLASEPLQGTVTWFAEVYAPGGITANGVTVTPSPTDSTQVTVTVASTVVGEVILHASYTATTGDAVMANPMVVATIASTATRTGIALPPSPVTTTAGETLSLELDNVYYDGTSQPVFLGVSSAAQFTSSNPNVLTVDAYGTVTGVAPGQATVTVSYGGYSAKTTVTVVAPGLGPQITSAGTATGTVGTAFSYQIVAANGPTSFKATGLPTGLSINAGTGLISGKPTTVGTFTVTTEAANLSGADTNTLIVTVGQVAQTISFPAIPTQFSGTKLTLGATASSGLAITYTVVSGPATVSGNVLTLTGGGAVTVEASQAGNASYAAAASVSESFAVFQAQTVTFPAIANRGFGTVPFTLGATASSGLPITYTSTGPVNISGGVATLTGVGTVRIRASQPGNASYAAATSVLETFTVTAGAQTLTFPAVATQKYGGALTLEATASSGLPVSYALVSGPATLAGNGLTFTGVGTVVVSASQAGNVNYLAAAPVMVNITVNPAVQTLTFPVIGNQVYPTAAFPTGAVASSGLGVYYTTSGPVKIVNGMATLTGGGTVGIRAHQDGDADYAAAATVLRTFTVVKGP